MLRSLFGPGGRRHMVVVPVPARGWRADDWREQGGRVRELWWGEGAGGAVVRYVVAL